MPNGLDWENKTSSPLGQVTSKAFLWTITVGKPFVVKKPAMFDPMLAVAPNMQTFIPDGVAPPAPV